MNIYVHSWYLGKVFLEGEIFHAELLEKIKTHALDAQ